MVYYIYYYIYGHVRHYRAGVSGGGEEVVVRSGGGGE